MKITIPPAALEAGAIDALFSDSLPLTEDYKRNEWGRYTEQTREKYRQIARAAFEAMVGAWPGMWAGPMELGEGKMLILPLPTEASDE